MSTNIWDEVKSTSNGSTKVFNGGISGDASCMVKVESMQGKVGPMGNALPVDLLYNIIFTDPTRPESREVRHAVYNISDDINAAGPADQAKLNFNLKKMHMNMARQVFEAVCPGADLPMNGSARDIIKAIYDQCAAKTEPTAVRAFFHFKKGKNPDTWLNWNYGFDTVIVNAADTTTVFKATEYMNRPKPDAEVSATTSEQVGDDLPF